MGIVPTLIDKIDIKTDISIVEKESIVVDKVASDVNSIRTFAKPNKGHWVLVYDGKVVKLKQYIEKGTVYYKGTVFYGTEEEVNAKIKELGLNENITPIIAPISR